MGGLTRACGARCQTILAITQSCASVCASVLAASNQTSALQLRHACTETAHLCFLQWSRHTCQLRFALPDPQHGLSLPAVLVCPAAGVGARSLGVGAGRIATRPVLGVR